MQRESVDRTWQQTGGGDPPSPPQKGACFSLGVIFPV
jgi:hypothetical protein